ncbi:hypothetical protein KBD45_08150, partial [Candidatus Dojkabacteria bacterium]|nr:hypothetical protein [Candidatus Dojkabacteria bacterium]
MGSSVLTIFKTLATVLYSCFAITERMWCRFYTMFLIHAESLWLAQSEVFAYCWLAASSKLRALYHS